MAEVFAQCMDQRGERAAETPGAGDERMRFFERRNALRRAVLIFLFLLCVHFDWSGFARMNGGQQIVVHFCLLWSLWKQNTPTHTPPASCV